MTPFFPNANACPYAQRSRYIQKRTQSKVLFLNSFASPYFVDPEVRYVRDMLSTPQLNPLGAPPSLLIYFMLSTIQKVVMASNDDSP